MSPEEMRPEDYGRPVGRSGAVTTVAVLNFVIGGLFLLCGLLTMVGGAVVGGLAGQAGKIQPTPGMDPKQVEALNKLAQGGGGMIATIIGFVGVCYLILSVPAIIAGVGVLKQAQWGRILTIVLGIVAGLLALLSLASFPVGLVGTFLYGGYCIAVLVILFNSQYAAEFR